MSDAEITAVAAIFSAIFAGWSAWSSHRSAQEAKKARKTQNIELLTPYFKQADGVWRFLFEEGSVSDICSARESIAVLKRYFSPDTEFTNVLAIMEGVIRNYKIGDITFPYDFEEDARDLPSFQERQAKEKFRSKMNECLCIG